MVVKDLGTGSPLPGASSVPEEMDGSQRTKRNGPRRLTLVEGVKTLATVRRVKGVAQS